MAGPTTFPSVKRFVGFAKEITPGTPVAPAAYMPVTKMDWNDKPTWLKDKGMRGTMAEDAFAIIQGVQLGELDFEGPVFADELGYLIGNIMGSDDTTGASAPFTHKFSLLNSGGGQPTTHTVTQYYMAEPTHNGRQFAGACVSEVGFKFNAESELLTYTAKAASWISNVAAATPTFTGTTAKPLPSWQSVLGIGGVASGGTQVLTVQSGEFNFKRAIKPYFTAQNSQNPYIIQRGGLTMDWKLSFVAADESPLTYMRNNTQPQIQFILNNGLATTSALVVQVDIAQAAFTEAKPNFGSEAVMFDAMGECVLNTTNIGTSGGYGPATISLQNAIAASTYV
jgi:Phage tail tube protein